MKELLILIATLFLCPYSQDKNEVELFTYWEIGDTQTLIIEEGFIEYEGSEIIKKDVSIDNVLITVLAETDSTYTVEWNYINVEYDRINIDTDLEDDEFDRRLDQMFENEKYVIEINEFGEFKKMLNKEELIAKVSDSMDVLIKEEMTELGEDAEMFGEIMKEMFSSELMMEEITRDFENYHYFLGGVYTADTLTQYEDEYENKLGGDPLPLKGTWSFNTDWTNMLFTFEDKCVVDEEKTKNAISATINKLDKKKGEEFEKKFAENEIQIEDHEKYIYDFDYGWLKFYETKRVYITKDKTKETFLRMRESG